MVDLSRLSELIPAEPGTADWSIPTRIRVGVARSTELTEACREAGITRPLVVSDTGLVASGTLAVVLEPLMEAFGEVAVFDSVSADPDHACVDAGARSYRSADCDGIVAVGGGSVLDAAKLISLSVAADRPIADLVGCAESVTEPIVPVIALPTTAGTGSEVGRAAVLSVPGESKTIIFHPRLMPVSVICDPLLTIGLPRPLTVATGFDALSHALEAWCSPALHPTADAIAAESARLALTALPVAADEPDHLGARQQMMVAALMGATAFQKGLGIMHALSHPIGAIHRTHHGLTNAVLMPFALEANRPAIEPKMDRLATWVGIEGGMNGILEVICAQREALGVPDTLVELGVGSDGWDRLIDAAVVDPSAATNPIPVTSEFARRVLIAASGN